MPLTSKRREKKTTPKKENRAPDKKRALGNRTLGYKSGRHDLNVRPSAPKADALARLRYAPLPRRTEADPRTGLIIPPRRKSERGAIETKTKPLISQPVSQKSKARRGLKGNRRDGERPILPRFRRASASATCAAPCDVPRERRNEASLPDRAAL